MDCKTLCWKVRHVGRASEWEVRGSRRGLGTLSGDGGEEYQANETEAEKGRQSTRDNQ